MKFDRRLLMLCTSEFIGTAILMCVGCSSVVGHKMPNWERSIPQISIAFGLSIHISIHTLGVISGSHINPSVTIAAIVLGNLKWDIGCFYMISQVCGAMAGYSLLLASLTEKVRGHALCATMPSKNIDLWQGVLIEFFMTSVLVYFCCGVWDKRNTKIHDSVPIRFGFLITGLVLTTVVYTGTSMNVARSLPPAIIYGAWDGFWIYPVGTIPAAILTPLAWMYLHTAESSDGGGDSAEP